jgi:hypothetical protein
MYDILPIIASGSCADHLTLPLAVQLGRVTGLTEIHGFLKCF